MRWIGILVSCCAAASMAASHFEDHTWNPDLYPIMGRQQPRDSPLIPHSFRIQRRGNCLGRSCQSREHDPGSPRATKAHAIIHGPGTAQTKIADSSFKMSTIPTGQSREVKSSHPSYAYVGATALSRDARSPSHVSDPIHPLKVKSQGRFVQALISVPDGGKGRVRLSGDNGIKEIHVQEGTMGGGVASSRKLGGAKAFGEVSRGGEAHVWSLAHRSEDD